MDCGGKYRELQVCALWCVAPDGLEQIRSAFGRSGHRRRCSGQMEDAGIGLRGPEYSRFTATVTRAGGEIVTPSVGATFAVVAGQPVLFSTALNNLPGRSRCGVGIPMQDHRR